jgi:hypothetical protein
MSILVQQECVGEYDFRVIRIQDFEITSVHEHVRICKRNNKTFNSYFTKTLRNDYIWRVYIYNLFDP